MHTHKVHPLFTLVVIPLWSDVSHTVMIAIWGSNINIIKVSPRVLYNCKEDMKTTVRNLTLSNVLKVSRGTSTAQVDRKAAIGGLTLFNKS